MKNQSPYLMIRMLAIFYLVSIFFSPLFSGFFVVSTPVTTTSDALISPPPPTKEEGSRTVSSEPASLKLSSRKGIKDSISMEGQKDYLHLNFPDEGPESAMLADLLSQMAVRTLLDPLVRPANLLEIVDTLTYSVYTTMIMMGTLVFGLGLLFLTWKVYNSVSEAAKVEPVTLSFLCTIPGLRYLHNHVRYHLFDMPLQPRRRFASFVGTRGSHLNLLEDLQIISSSEPIITKGGRRESLLRFDSNNISTSNSAKSRRKSILKSIPPSIPPPPPPPPQHHQSAPPTSAKKNYHSPNTEVPNLRKRHSMATVGGVMLGLVDGNNNEKNINSSLPPPPPSPIAPEAMRNTIPSTTTNGRSPNTMEQSFNSSGHAIPLPSMFTRGVELASPVPRSISIVPQMVIGGDVTNIAAGKDSSNFLNITNYDEAEQYQDRNRSTSLPSSSAPSSRRSSLESGGVTAIEAGESTFNSSPNLEEPIRSWTPISSSLSNEEATTNRGEEDLNQRRVDWVRNMPFFNNDHHFLSPEVSKTRPIVESKLSRRLGTTATLAGGGPQQSGLEHSKLSRYFTTNPPPHFAKSTNISETVPVPCLPLCNSPLPRNLDTISSRLQEGDLTPPPGFGRRHSSATLALPQARYSSGLVAAMREEEGDDDDERGIEESELEAEDMVTCAADYHAAFINASQRRRSAFIPSGKSSKLGKLSKEEMKVTLLDTFGESRRRRILSETKIPPVAAMPLSRDPETASWRWFLGGGGLNHNSNNTNTGPTSGGGVEAAAIDMVWDPPARPHSTEIYRSHPAPVGTGSRSSGRVTPEASTLRRYPNDSISLGIFDDLFEFNKVE